jgi:uncharacterized protein
MADNKTPGVYIEEIPHLPPSIVSVETAIPAFIGYTEKAQAKDPGDLFCKPFRIESLFDYEQHFGYPDPEKESLSVIFSISLPVSISAVIDETKRSAFLMHYSMQMFFANGGGPCWIIAAGTYSAAGVEAQKLKDGLTAAATINEVTLLVFPDAVNLSNAVEYYDLYTQAMIQCFELQDRFTVMDVYYAAGGLNTWEADINGTGGIQHLLSAGTGYLKYGAVYFPRIYTGIDFNYKVTGDQQTDNDTVVKIVNGPAGVQTLDNLKNTNNGQYFQAKNALTNIPMLLPASSAIAGIYAMVDNARGVWKAPANVNIANVTRPEYLISNEEQENLNVDTVGGKSINVIRTFPGHGPAIVWGARTLDGNSNDWRYISVRRYFNMVEESVKNATEQFVFEPNDQNTWVRVKAMIQNYLTEQWKSGALMGTTTKEAFFVHLGLGETMTEQDILEGRMIVEIGMAVVKPAEFIIITFMHKMLQES